MADPATAAPEPARPAIAFPIGDPPPWAGLTPRELDVLRYICEGRADREIGERLFISERTVHVHVRHLLAKLGVPSRTRAASLALRSGLLDGRWATPSGDRTVGHDRTDDPGAVPGADPAAGYLAAPAEANGPENEVVGTAGTPSST
jgi:hypothetical protein